MRRPSVLKEWQEQRVGVPLEVQIDREKWAYCCSACCFF